MNVLGPVQQQAHRRLVVSTESMPSCCMWMVSPQNYAELKVAKKVQASSFQRCSLFILSPAKERKTYVQPHISSRGVFSNVFSLQYIHNVRTSLLPPHCNCSILPLQQEYNPKLWNCKHPYKPVKGQKVNNTEKGNPLMEAKCWPFHSRGMWLELQPRR